VSDGELTAEGFTAEQAGEYTGMQFSSLAGQQTQSPQQGNFTAKQTGEYMGV